jgi:hypothetical protein
MKLIIILLSCLCVSTLMAQSDDSLKFDYRKIYSLCLDGNVKPVLALIEADNKKISATDTKFKADFENRFKYEFDKSNYLVEKKSPIDSLLLIFRVYWRESLLDTKNNYDTLIIRKYRNFLLERFPALTEKDIKEDSTDLFIRKYLTGKNLYSTGFGKTGRIYDLLVWKTQIDTTYTFNIYKEKITANVVFMKDFVTLGWEEYATLGKYYPGGWATNKALYCVQSAYDLNSENFLISYLAHEGRHFKDYKLFPKLKNSADLEYRAKLTELSLAKKTLFDLIAFFIANANYDSENGHQIANYCVVRDLSKELFKVEFEKNIEIWKLVNIKKINKAAYKVLQKNTKELMKNAHNVEKFVKP